MINLMCSASNSICQRSVFSLSKMFSKSLFFNTYDAFSSEHSRPSVKHNPDTRHVDLIKEDLISVFNTAVSSVLPQKLIRDTLKISGQTLVVGKERYTLKRNCHVVGFGKAVLGMAVETENILQDHIVSGVISIPLGMKNSLANSSDFLLKENSAIEIMEGAKDNMADEMAFEAAKKISNIAECLDENDLLIVLVSGGGSALLPYPKPPVTIDEKNKLVHELASRGGNIRELNCIRKKLSVLKGGGLGKLAHPAQVITLILSDIIDDPLEDIASGPTVLNTDPPNKALDIIRQYNLQEYMSSSIHRIIHSPHLNDVKLPLDAPDLDHIQNVVIGNNAIAVDAAKEEAIKKGYTTIILSKRSQSLVCLVSEVYVTLTVLICKLMSELISEEDFRKAVSKLSCIFEPNIGDCLVSAIRDIDDSKGICLISGGEPTVNVCGKGRGGRNQELALSVTVQLYMAAALQSLLEKFSIAFLSAGTDGIDGPTDAAGAFGYLEQYELAKNEGLSPRRYLDINGSYEFYSKFQKGKDLLKTGHTGTNVMDLHMLVIQKRN